MLAALFFFIGILFVTVQLTRKKKIELTLKSSTRKSNLDTEIEAKLRVKLFYHELK